MEKNAIVLFDYEPSEHDELRLVKGGNNSKLFRLTRKTRDGL